MTLWDDIYELRRQDKIPRLWKSSHLREHLPNPIAALRSVPANQSISKDGRVLGNYVKSGRPPKAWRIPPPRSGLYELIEDPSDDEATQQAALDKVSQLLGGGRKRQNHDSMEIQILSKNPRATGIKKAVDFVDDLHRSLRNYRYQPELTSKLDGIGDASFNQEIINEIVLWKTDRYAQVDTDTLHKLDGIKSLQMGEHRQGRVVLESLLETRGIGLPMASTILRFRNSMTFQIIDQRAFRAIYGQRYPINSATPVPQKVSVYFNYLDELVKFCIDHEESFETIDRLLYQFDKERNGKLKV